MKLSLRFHFFGSFEMFWDGKPLPKPATLKSQSLLAYLILHRHSPQRRDQLCSLFWGDRPESKARGSLSTALWQIHRCLPEGQFILTDVESVRFNPATQIWLDAEEFISRVSIDDLESLSAATDLYRGDFLNGFYDDWIMDERYHLEGLYCSALARLMIAHETAQQHDAALSAAKRLLRCDPLREEAHRLVMRVYCQLGQRNAALSQYTFCQDILQRELRAEPTLETTMLYQSILSGRFQTAPAPGTVAIQVSPPTAFPATGRSPFEATLPSAMVGRQRELTLLQHLWKATEPGQGSLVFIEGEAGVGKTRLLEEFSSEIRRRGFRVLSGRCYEFERLLPYQPIAEVLRMALPTLSSEERANMPSWVFDIVTQLVPDHLSERTGITSSDNALQDQAYLFSGISQFLSSLAASGAILVVLEDLHWASESTLQLLHYLTCYMRERPVLVISTYRTEAVDAGHPLSKMQEQLRRDRLAQKIILHDLSADNVTSMLMEMSGMGEEITALAQRLYQDTEGNPFFLVETIKGLFEREIIQLERGKWRVDLAEINQTGLPLPKSLSEAIQARLQSLSKDVQGVLQMAAVLGREFDFDLLEMVWGRGHEFTLEAIDCLLRQRLIEEGSGPTSRDYVFVHHKIREVVYSAIPRHRRQYLHARVAATLEKLYAARLDAVLNEVAYHYEQCYALDPEWAEKALRFLLQAGDRARDLSAFHDAADFYQRALVVLKKGKDQDRTARTLIKLAQTYHILLDFKRSRQAYDEAFRSWQQSKRDITPSVSTAPHALRIQWREPQTLDPALPVNEWSRAVTGNLFSGLTALTGEGDVAPDMAYAWDILDSGRQYIFHIREDARWSDGIPVTADDFVYAWRRVLSPTVNSPIADMLFTIKNASAFYRGEISDPNLIQFRAINETTLQVELERPDGFFLHTLPDFPAVPRHAVQKYDESWTKPKNIVSNGPFLLKDWAYQQRMTLVRNPAYTGRIPGNIEEVELCLLPDILAQYRLYDAGDLDLLDFWAIPLPERDHVRYKNVSERLSLPQLSTIYVCLDVSRPPLDDVRVRKALAHAIDKESLADIFMHGDLAPARGGFLPPGMPAYSAEADIPFDQERARSLMVEAGYSAATGIRFPRVNGLLPEGTLRGFTNLLSQQWQETLGIEIEWKTAEKDQPQLRLYGAGCEYPNPAHFIRWSELGDSHWHNEQFLALVEQAEYMTDPARQLMFYRQADKLLMDEVPVIPLTYGRNLMLIKPWVKNFPVSPLFYWPWKELILEPH